MAHGSEWEAVWADYDREAVLPPRRRAAGSCDTRPAPPPRAMLLVVLLLGMGTLALPMIADGPGHAQAGERHAAPASLSPVEADLPPLAVSFARLAGKSALAACWAMQLRPQGGGCAEFQPQR